MAAGNVGNTANAGAATGLDALAQNQAQMTQQMGQMMQIQMQNQMDQAIMNAEMQQFGAFVNQMNAAMKATAALSKAVATDIKTMY
ncbi:MAG: hypothetical protein ACFCBW_07755 [Candidatus Competibacterales bacterium]